MLYILYQYICKFLRRFKVEIFFHKFKNVIKNQFIGYISNILNNYKIQFF